MISINIGTREKTIIIPPLAGLAIIAAAIVIIGDIDVVGNSIIIAVFVSTVPYFFYRYSKYAWLKSIERQFPNFLRDLADSRRSGMTLENAVKMASRNNYGKLTPEVKTMSNKLSWGVPFLRVMEMFGQKVRESPSITEVLNIIKESHRSGGDVVATLDSAARNMGMLREAEEERKSITGQHVMITYGIFFLFLGIVVTIIMILVPMMKTGVMSIETSSVAGITSFTNPCSKSALIFPCGLFGSTCGAFGINEEGISCYYVALFFYVLIIQGLFSGMIAGQLGENSVIAGVKHSLIMISICVFVFIFMTRLGLFPG